jgi:hypothetical protein
LIVNLPSGVQHNDWMGSTQALTDFTVALSKKLPLRRGMVIRLMNLYSGPEEAGVIGASFKRADRQFCLLSSAPVQGLSNEKGSRADRGKCVWGERLKRGVSIIGTTFL